VQCMQGQHQFLLKCSCIMCTPRGVCVQVPKMLYALRHYWSPGCMLVSFKLETDESILLRKVGCVLCDFPSLLSHCLCPPTTRSLPSRCVSVCSNMCVVGHCNAWVGIIKLWCWCKDAQPMLASAGALYDGRLCMPACVCLCFACPLPGRLPVPCPACYPVCDTELESCVLSNMRRWPGGSESLRHIIGVMLAVTGNEAVGNRLSQTAAMCARYRRFCCCRYRCGVCAFPAPLP
jgi:hypothetical protein